MSTVDETSWTENDLDAALAELLAASLTSGEELRPRTVGPTRRRRWIAPVAAAVAVAAVAVGAVVGTQAKHQADLRASTGTAAVSNGIADVGGVRFPVPQGWTVDVTDSNDVFVTACVAEVPAIPCDGVTMTIAVEDGRALPNSVHDPVMGGHCSNGGGGYVQVESNAVLAGRPAAHYFGGSCTADGPEAHLWVLIDNSLAMTTPLGRWSDEIASVAAGLDLSNWPHDGGGQKIFSTQASMSPTTG